jgi:hypothetical protein
LAFIGSKVNAVYEKNKIVNSDVLKVVLFLRKVIEDKKFLENNFDKIINGNQEFKNELY